VFVEVDAKALAVTLAGEQSPCATFRQRRCCEQGHQRKPPAMLPGRKSLGAADATLESLAPRFEVEQEIEQVINRDGAVWCTGRWVAVVVEIDDRAPGFEGDQEEQQVVDGDRGIW